MTTTPLTPTTSQTSADTQDCITLSMALENRITRLLPIRKDRIIRSELRHALRLARVLKHSYKAEFSHF
jgi:hypothetical protein